MKSNYPTEKPAAPSGYANVRLAMGVGDGCMWFSKDRGWCAPWAPGVMFQTPHWVAYPVEQVDRQAERDELSRKLAESGREVEKLKQAFMHLRGAYPNFRQYVDAVLKND